MRGWYPKERTMRDYRKLYASIVVSEKLANVPMDARWLWVLLLVSQDDDGKYPWTPVKIKALTVGTNWSNEDVQNLAIVLTESQLIHKDNDWMYISKGVDKNGKPSNAKGLMVYDSASTESQLSLDSVSTQSELSPDSVSTEYRVEKSRVKQITDDFVIKMKERFTELRDIDEIIETALAHKAVRKYVDHQAYVRNWLKNEAERRGTNGRIQHVEQRKLRGAAESWTGWNHKSG
jgi:hypothetical protein